ncbi:MAG: hypothetical protein ACRCWO_09265, partial [Bosea sp. (in: a-proteobacteria)]
MSSIILLVIQLFGGAIAGKFAGGATGNSLGGNGNLIAGAVGGLLGGQTLGGLLAMGSSGLDIGSIISGFASGGIG